MRGFLHHILSRFDVLSFLLQGLFSFTSRYLHSSLFLPGFVRSCFVSLKGTEEGPPCLLLLAHWLSPMISCLLHNCRQLQPSQAGMLLCRMVEALHHYPGWNQNPSTELWLKSCGVPRSLCFVEFEINLSSNNKLNQVSANNVEKVRRVHVRPRKLGSPSPRMLTQQSLIQPAVSSCLLRLPQAAAPRPNHFKAAHPNPAAQRTGLHLSRSVHPLTTGSKGILGFYRVSHSVDNKSVVLTF